MTLDEMLAEFEKETHFSDFENLPIESRPFNRSDLCALIKLGTLCPGSEDMIAAAEHDQIFLGIDVEELAAAATPEDIRYLSICGVFYDSQYDSLMMFV